MALPSGMSDTILPVASTCPCTKCPPIRPPNARDRSRLTRSPLTIFPRLDRRRVSGITSTAKCGMDMSMTVRHTPFTATLSPSLSSSVIFWPTIRSVVPAMSLTTPSSSTIPVNIFSVLFSLPLDWIAAHHDIITEPTNGHPFEREGIGNLVHTSPCDSRLRLRTAYDYGGDKDDQLVDQVGIEQGADQSAAAFNQHMSYLALAKLLQQLLEVHQSLARSR